MYGEQLPELPADETLTDIWQRLNYAREGFMGALPFEWRELQSFSEMTQRDLSPLEAECLMDMSKAYCAELAQRSALRKAPMERDT